MDDPETCLGRRLVDLVSRFNVKKATEVNVRVEWDKYSGNKENIQLDE